MKDTALQWYWAAAISVAMAVVFVIDPQGLRLAGLGGSFLASWLFYWQWSVTERLAQEKIARQLEREFLKREFERMEEQKQAASNSALLDKNVPRGTSDARVDGLAAQLNTLDDDVEKLKLALNIRQLQAQPATISGSGHLKS